MASKYPEHEKLEAVHTESQAIGEFLEWLNGERGLVICQSGIADERPVYWTDVLDTWAGDPKKVKAEALKAGVITEQDARGSYYLNVLPKLRVAVHHWEPYEREGFFPAHIGIEKLLAEYFDIDLKKISAEKDQMLDEIRAVNA